MPGVFHLGLVALLLVLGGSLLLRQERPTPRGVAWQVALALGVILWGGTTLAAIARDHGPGLEVERYTLRPPPHGDAVTLGTHFVADVPLFDEHAAAVHAVIRWSADGDGDPRPSIWNASDAHRLEVDGVDSTDVVLTARTELTLGARTLEVMAGGPWPGLTLIDDRGAIHRLRAGPVRGLLAMLPGVGAKVSTSLAWLQPDGEGYALRGAPPLPGTGPVAVLATSGSEARLTFAAAADRASHPVVIDRPGEPPLRPGDRTVPLRAGQILTLGYSRFAVDVQRGGVVALRSVGTPARVEWPAEARIVDADAGFLLAGDALGAELAVASLDPERRVGLQSLGDRTRAIEGGDQRAVLGAGDRLELPVGPGATATLRVVSASSPAAALEGGASSLDQDTWRGLVVLAALYVAVSVLAALLGLLHVRSAGLLHGAAILFTTGLVCLYRLAEPGDSLRAGWALRQLHLGTAAIALAAAGLFAIAAVAWLRSRRGLRPLRGDGLFRWLDGPEADGARARWLYVIAVVVLVLQLPFGEAGIALPGLGSVQPIELARTLLVVYLAYWTSRALEAKQTRLRGPEGLSARWAYMAHAGPVVVVLGLCYGLHDISPILVFVVFLAVFYALSLMRPSLRIWPLQALREHLAVDGVLVGGVLLGAGFLLLGDPDGTVARRIQVWWDPWNQTAEAYQSMTALWAAASGGVWGLGWTGANGVLPPAVRDDFILALLAARGGAAAVTLVAATFALMLASGAASIRRDASAADVDRRGLLAGGMLWMLVIQAAVVLGSATGGLPVMGQPLPFVAAAGSHLLLFCLPALATVLWCTRVPLAAEDPVRSSRRPPRRPVELPDVPDFVAPPPRPRDRPLPLPPLSLSPTTDIPIVGPITEGGR